MKYTAHITKVETDEEDGDNIIITLESTNKRCKELMPGQLLSLSVLLNAFDATKEKKLQTLVNKLRDNDPILFDLSQKLGPYLLRHIDSLSKAEREDYDKINEQIRLHYKNKS